RPGDCGTAEECDELAPLYPNHVIPRAYAVWVRLKRTLAALAYFAQCLGRRSFPLIGSGRDEPLVRPITGGRCPSKRAATTLAASAHSVGTKRSGAAQ